MSGYELAPTADVVISLVRELVADREPYLSADNCPDMVDAKHEFVLYRVPASDPFACIGQSVEGSVLHEVWSCPPPELTSCFAEIDPNTTWLILIDRIFGRAVPVGVMSIADCLHGPSETLTVAATLAHKEGRGVPAQLTITPNDLVAGLWDVMQLSVLPTFRGSFASAWLQHALYRSSIDAVGANRWVANMTTQEFRALTSLGIPFEQIAGLLGTSDWLPPEVSKDFGFYSVDVSTIRASTSATLERLIDATTERRRQFSAHLADMASISLDGRRIPTNSLD